MIIEKIKLQGFMSYIDEEVDFRKYHTLLISGANGEGKSALLEGVPFCYWGIGRGKSLSDYVNDNCSTLRLEVTFLMENLRYKKIRQYGKAGKINELYIDKTMKQLEDAEWNLISDDSKRKTDELLSEILGLDYNIFYNSIFFGQKEESSFIDGEASERKELLCNLLGIQVYEDAEEVTKDFIKELDNKIQTKSFVLNEKSKLAEQKITIQTQFSSTTQKLNDQTKQIKELTDHLTTNRKKQETIKINIAGQDKNKQQLSDIIQQQSKIKSKKEQLQEDIKAKDVELEETIEEGIDAVESLQTIIDLNNESKLLEQKSEYEKTLSEISSHKLKMPDIKDKLTNQRNAKEKLIQQQTEVNTKILSLKDKKKKIEKSGAICPVIDEPCNKLSEDNKKQTVEAIEKDIAVYNKDLLAIEKDLTSTKAKILELDGNLESLNKKIQRETSITTMLATTNDNLKQRKEAIDNLPKVKVKYREKVDKFEAAKAKLAEQMIEIVNSTNELQVKKEEIEKSLSTSFNDDLIKVQKQIKAYENDLESLNEEKQSLSVQLGEIKSKMDGIELAEKDVKQMQEEIDILSKDLRVYTELSILFGKNGIQKDIINDNVPVLEQKTNEILSKFCKNSQLQVRFDLDPVKKSGELKKKGGLDIVIFEKGKQPRTLNMYSGGETIRIVFAILLSLSYLLTKRAGKKSHTLIIDERIAALDQEGINEFIEIIKYLQDQYKKIIIVSHITELKDAFSEIMLVKKTQDGSKISLLNNK
jgi:exonuclease SbcC